MRMIMIHKCKRRFRNEYRDLCATFEDSQSILQSTNAQQFNHPFTNKSSEKFTINFYQQVQLHKSDFCFMSLSKDFTYKCLFWYL